MKPKMMPTLIASLVIAWATLAGPLARAGNTVAPAAPAAPPAAGAYYLRVSNDLVGNAYADFRSQLSTTAPVPPPAPQEPETARYGMLLAGLGVLGMAARRRKSALRA